MIERREFLRTGTLAVAAALSPAVPLPKCTGRPMLVLTTRGGFVRGANDAGTEVMVGVIGRGPWKCEKTHPQHAMLITDDAGNANFAVTGDINMFTADSGKKLYDLTNASVEISGYDGSQPLKLATTANPTSFPQDAADWNDTAYMPTLSMLKPNGSKIDDNWRGKLGSTLKIPCGTTTILPPFNSQAAKALWGFQSSGGGVSVDWKRAMTDSVQFCIPLTEYTCTLHVDYGYKTAKLTLTPQVANSAIAVVLQASDVSKATTYQQNDRIQHFEMFYTLLDNEATWDCDHRVVPVYLGNSPMKSGGATPGDYCPAPWV